MHHASNKKVIIHSSSGAHVIKDFVPTMSLKVVSYHMLYNPHSLFFSYATSAHTLRGLSHIASQRQGGKTILEITESKSLSLLPQKLKLNHNQS